MQRRRSIPRRLGPAVLAALAALLVAGCGTGARDAAPSAHPSGTVAGTPDPGTTPPEATPPATQPPTDREPADGTNLRACQDGTCEVEIRAGDVIRFGARVRSTPPLDSLTVLSVDSQGPTLQLSSGMTTTAYGTIEMNDTLRFETLSADGKRAVVNISLLR